MKALGSEVCLTVGSVSKENIICLKREIYMILKL